MPPVLGVLADGRSHPDGIRHCKICNLRDQHQCSFKKRCFSRGEKDSVPSCLASLSRNWSSTSLWLRYFNHSGIVLAMDPVIDFLDHHAESLKKDILEGDSWNAEMPARRAQKDSKCIRAAHFPNRSRGRQCSEKTCRLVSETSS